MTDISSDPGRQLLIANDPLVGSLAAVMEKTEDSRIDCIGGRLDYLLFHDHGPEAKPPRRVFQRARRKMIDVLGIKFLERRVEILVIAGSVGRLEIQIAAWRKQPSRGHEEGGDIVNVLEHMAEHDAVKLRH